MHADGTGTGMAWSTSESLPAYQQVEPWFAVVQVGWGDVDSSEVGGNFLSLKVLQQELIHSTCSPQTWGCAHNRPAGF